MGNRKSKPCKNREETNKRNQPKMFLSFLAAKEKEL